MMLNYVSKLNDKQKSKKVRAFYRQKALDLFIGAGKSYTINNITYPPVKMQVTSIKTGRKFEIPISKYLTDLINLNYSNIKITYTEVVDLKASDLQKIDEDLYQCTVQYSRIYKRERDGRLRYQDNAVKKIVCFIKRSQIPDGDGFEYLTLLGDTHCEQN